MIQFVQSVSAPVTRDQLYLFQVTATHEGAILFSQLSKICGLRISLRQVKGIQENVHYFLLEGNSLRALRQENREQLNFRGSRLLFLTESGVAFVISSYLQKATIRWGAWLFSDFFLSLPGRSSENFSMDFYSEELRRDIQMYMLQGRVAFSLAEVLRGTAIHVDPIFHAYCGLIPNVDWVCGDSEETNYLFLPGLYRVWHQYPQLYSWKNAYEKEFTSFIYQATMRWQRQEIQLHQVKESPYFFSSAQTSAWQEVMRRIQDIQKCVKVLMDQCGLSLDDGEVIAANLTGDLKKQVENRISLMDVNQTAKQLGIFYSDQKTPHLVFMRHLLEIAATKNLSRLKGYLRENLQFQKGINEYDYRGMSFRIWWQT